MDYKALINPENLFASFDEFKRGKRKKEDVMNFERNLEENIFKLHHELKEKIYSHSSYEIFNIWDPKYRTISKACVKDRVVHHMLFNYLYELFDKTFIFHAYSSRVGKGTHIGVKNLHRKMRKASRNFKKPCYALKCDIRKFFAGVNHKILLDLIANKIIDIDILWLTRNIVESYENSTNTGIPLGNVTSQLFANVYLNELDQFIKHELRIRYYLRYADDFVILNREKSFLENIIPAISDFLEKRLKLSLHSQKVSIRKIRQGVDFLGYVCCLNFRVIRTKTKKRMFKKIEARKQKMLDGERSAESLNQTLQNYLGMLQHANSYCLSEKIKGITKK